MQRRSVSIQLDRDHPTPLPIQLADQVEAAIRIGNLQEGEFLPSVRQWARKLAVSTMTITSAYAELGQRHLVHAEPRSGYRVIGRGVLQSETDPIGMHRIQPYLPDHPSTEFGVLIAEACATDSAAAGYEDYRGYMPLRQEMVRLAAAKGIVAHEWQILITQGAQQGIQLVASMLQPNQPEYVLVEQPAYPGAIRAFAQSGVRLLPVPMLENGPDLTVLETHLRQNPVRLMYACPNYQNPTGYSYSEPVRRRLLEIAERYGLHILEDDYLGDLDYQGEHLPTLKSLDPGNLVYYLCTFSKCLLPGIRCAYLIAEEAVVDRLSNRKSLQDICGSAMIQRALHLFISRGRYQAHLERVRPIYQAKREALQLALVALQNRLTITQPPAGLSVFCTLPHGQDAAELVMECEKEGLLISFGGPFFTQPELGFSSFRLGNGGLSMEDIPLALERLGIALNRLQTPRYWNEVL